MMQMLSAGGLDVLTDGTREADENNKKGYLELEAVKNLKKDKRVIAAAKDKVVKVVSPLLQHLPPQFYYKIIMMERDVDEILLSQGKNAEA